MPDAQITVSAVSSAPADYGVSGAADFILKAVNAEFDGSGAGVAYCPAVVVISDSGHVVARALDPSSTVAAGASAEASFFPGVKSAAAAASATSVLHWFSADTGVNNLSIPSNSARFVTFNRAGATFDVVDDGSSPSFQAPGTGGAGELYPQVLKPSYLFVAIQTFWDAGAYYRYNIVGTPGTASTNEIMENESQGAVNGATDNRLSWVGPLVLSNTFGSGPPSYVTVQVYQSSGAPLNLQRARLHVAVLGAQN